MTVRLISAVRVGDQIRARVRAHAPAVGVHIWMEIAFESAAAGRKQREWMEEAYERALSVLDPA